MHSKMLNVKYQGLRAFRSSEQVKIVAQMKRYSHHGTSAPTYLYISVKWTGPIHYVKLKTNQKQYSVK